MAQEVANIKVTLNLDKEKFDKGVDEAQSQSKKLEGDLSSDFTKFGKKATALGAGLTAAITVPLSLMAKSSVETFGTFNESVRRAGGFINATEEDIKLMEQAILDVGRNTPFSLQQVADAMGNFVGGEIDAKEAAQELSGVIDLALVAKIQDLQQAVNIGSLALTVFKDDAMEMSDVVDIFATVASDVTTETDKWSTAIVNSAGAAKAGGLSFKDLNIIFAEMVRGGADVNLIWAAFNSAMVNIQSPTDGAITALENVGLNIEGLKKALDSGPIDLLNYLGEGFDKANEKGEGFAFLADVLGRQAAPEFALALGLTNEEMAETAGWFEEIDGRGATLTDTLRKNISPADQLNKEWELMKIQLGRELVPQVIELVKQIQKLVDWFTNLDPESKKMIINIAKIAAVVGPAITIIGGLAIAIGAIASPVGLVILAIIAFGVQVAITVKQFQKSMQAMKDAWGPVKDFFINTWNLIKDGFASVVDGVTNFFTVTIPQKWQEFTKFLSDTWNGIVTAALKFWEDLKAGFKAGVDAVIDFIMKLPARFFQMIGLIGRGFYELAQLFFTFYTVTVPNFIMNVIDWFAKLPGRIATIAQNMWTTFTTWITKLWNDVTTAVINGVNNFIAWVQTLPGKITTAAINLYNSFTSWISKTWADVKSFTITGVNNVITWIGSLPEKIGNMARNLWENTKSGFNSFWESAKTWAGQVVDDIIKFFTDIPGRVADALGRAGNFAWSNIKKGFNMEFDALGTRSAQGGPTVVGERGIEVVNLERGDTVTPNHELGKAGLGNSFNITNNNYLNTEAAVAALEERMRAKTIAAKFGASIA